MLVERDRETLFQANFNKSRSGLASSVYYTLYNDDGTIFQARSNSNVTEQGSGKYGVLLTFTAYGNYSIYWDIDGTNLDAGEEINVLDISTPSTTLYRGYAH